MCACGTWSARIRHIPCRSGTGVVIDRMDFDRIMTRVNPLIVAILRSPLHGLMSSGLLLLTVTGRRTGRRYTIPVGYQKDGDRFIVLVSKARRKNWWRNYIEPGPLDLRVAGQDLRGQGWVVQPESYEFRKNVERTFKRMPWLAAQFAFAYDATTGLTDEQVAHLGREGAMVQIEIESPARSVD